MAEQQLAIVDQMSERGQVLLKKHLIRKQVHRHQQIIDRGDPVSGAYFVLTGCLRVFVYGPEGRESTLYRIEPGDTCVLALNALFNDLLYPAWVEAEEDTEVGVLPGSVYRQLFVAEPSMQDLTIRALSSAVFGLMASLEERASQTVEQRLVGYLLMAASSDGTLHNTQQELAGKVGTSREVVGRYMADFASHGLLKTSRGRITLLDIDGLNRVVGS